MLCSCFRKIILATVQGSWGAREERWGAISEHWGEAATGWWSREGEECLMLGVLEVNFQELLMDEMRGGKEKETESKAPGPSSCR